MIPLVIELFLTAVAVMLGVAGIGVIIYELTH